ncbi:TetR/AcrR family transcriptional regulator [Streptomyces thinghirensis]|nr:TetR/AcrR family transcriptional regulator [Streptomyces thinghirensis]
MNAIAAEAGITKPILYRHFGDKNGTVRPPWPCGTRTPSSPRCGPPWTLRRSGGNASRPP